MFNKGEVEMEIVINSEEFKKMIKEIVEEVIRKEILALRLSLLPYVDDEEQEELEKLFGKLPEIDEVEYEEEGKKFISNKRY